MKHLHLLIPDLFPPQEIAAEVCTGLHLPALEKILARGTASMTGALGLEGWLCGTFRADGVAPVRAAADGLAAAEGYWLCADPVNLQLQRAQVMLLPELELDQAEADALCASLNEHFAGMGLSFHAPQPQRWYVRAAEAAQATMYPLSQVVWRDVKPFQPQGADALHWQRIATETQMLLYAHPVNQAREARGELPVNSLWLWGGGQATRLQGPFDEVGGDSALGAAFAQTAGIHQAGSLQALLDGKGGSGLWICAAPGVAQQRGDYHAWREAAQSVEQEFAQPLLHAVRTGRVQRLTLEVLQAQGTRRFVRTGGCAGWLWRAARRRVGYAVGVKASAIGLDAMSFWDKMIGFSWGGESLLLLVMVLGMAVLLLHFRREERASLVNTVGFFFVCLFGQFISGVLHALEMTRAAAVAHEVFVIGAGIAVIRLWGLLVFRIVLPSIRFTPPRITEDIFVIIAYVAWFMVRLRYAGLDLGSILATSAVITAVVAFAMQDTLGNILGGLALQLDNSIEVGDWIKVDDISGKVVDIRWRSTLVETRNWETVVFPNSQLMKNKFLVLGRRTDEPVQWRRWVWFNVGLNVAPTRVVSVVEDSILQTDIANVARNPAPNCILMDMDNNGSGHYALRYWLTDLAPDDATDAAIRWHIMTALQRAGIKLALAESSIHITKENEKYEEVVHEREVLLRIKTLRRVELFSQLNDTELRALAERLRYSPFAKGNVIARQGDEKSHWLYIIINGDADVYVDLPNGKRRTVNTLGRGSFFGEMGLLTGAPRSASVVARTDVECYRIDKDVVEELLHARPSIAEEVSHILVKRRAELDIAMQNLDATGAHKDLTQQRSEILATIKRFFSLGS